MWPRNQLDSIAIDGGLPVQSFRLMIALVAICFIAPSIHLCSTENSRHVWNTLLGIFAGIFVFDYAIIHSLSTVFLFYGALHCCPRKLAGKLITSALFLYLLACHYYREFHAPDITWDASQMIVTLKLSSIAINYSDAVLSADQKTPLIMKNQLQEVPPILSILGFVFFYPGFLVGPLFEFKDYLFWMRECRFPPLSVCLRNLVLILVSGAGLAASFRFPIDQIDAPDFHREKPWVLRCLLMCFSVMLHRFRYYVVWSLAEAASALAGVGYVPSTGKWNGITNNNLLCVEIPPNVRVCINSWNIGVARWINTYVYQRVWLSKRTGKPTMISTMSSFFISALWHGLSPGYYLFFILSGLYIEVGKQLRRRLRPFFHYTEDRSAHPHAIFTSYWKGKSHPLAFLYDVAGVVLTWVAMQYGGIAFQILDVRRCLHVWASWYFLPQIICILVLLLAHIFPNTPKINHASDTSKAPDVTTKEL
uniref:Lysophospholipid acyltransferase putative n=1 Tax=Albugo laibachii Nc14 TaxID=890382 RepID=F0WZH9_9STRA|nr:lysophospholipid acyltransferase putative [Albugo laibachii Nc14]|eukprot:CCA26902.1 lysophospholipid acyltransferase putative [Albugo laibachii Nc14]